MISWEMFNQGLPNVIVTELEHHINSNKLFAASYGRGVWISDLPATAPPIASFDFTIIDECAGIVNFNNNSINASSTEWIFGDGSDNSIENNTSHQFVVDGNYDVTLIVNNVLGSDSISQTINIDVLDLPSVIENESCTSSALELFAESNNTNSIINWFDSPNNGNLLYTEATFTTDILYETTSYYVSSSEISSSNIGEIQHLGDNEYSGSSNSSGGLVFDVYKSSILESVDVFTNQAGERKIILLDNSNNIIAEHMNMFHNQIITHTILLNFQISPS